MRKIVAEAATRLREDLLKIAASLVARRMEGVDGEYVVISVLASGGGGEGPDPPSPSLPTSSALLESSTVCLYQAHGQPCTGRFGITA